LLEGEDALMLTLRIIDEHGLMQFLKVDSFEIERKCKWARCPRPLFYTIDPDQLYCKPSHSVRASEDRHIAKEPEFVSHPLRPRLVY
jgi:hypothetical protein